MTSQIRPPDFYNTSIIICCAGMGTRLGIGTTKALVDICGKPLIIRQLELLEKYNDIRIVVGFQAEKLIQTVNQYRKDIMYVFNYQYETTGVADSLRKALLGVKEYVISLDGDTLENEKDFSEFLSCDYECIPISKLTSAEPVKATIKDNLVTELSKSFGSFQWPGILKVRANRLNGNSPHVYEVISKQLPIKAFMMQTREIDTPEDYEQAIEWFEKGCID